MVPRDRVELPTHGASIHCSTNWAIEALFNFDIKKWRSRRESNPRSPAWQAGVITATPRDLRLKNCGRWIWTIDLWVMSPTSCQTAPSRDNKNGGGKGIRTPASFYTPVGFQDRSLQPDLGIPPWLMVDSAGLEPATDRLWADSSNQLS